MAPESFQKIFLFARLVTYGCRLSFSVLQRALSMKLATFREQTWPSPPPDPAEVKNVVVVGAAFSGYFAARILAASLPRGFQLTIIEASSHYNFTWVLPRFSVVEGHSHKAFIPYTPVFVAQGPKDRVRWIRDRVLSVHRKRVILRSGDEIPYEFLIIATGSTADCGLPSRTGVESKDEAIKLLEQMQGRIKAATRLVIAGGGAAGVELATDAKNQYPDKSVTLVHSRPAVMHRFGPRLQEAAMEALQRLGVEVILGERVLVDSANGQFITLSSGRKIECDCFISCMGQKPASGLVADIAPNAIAASGHIRVKPTLQIDDDSLPNVYACGDVVETKAPNPNSTMAIRQALVAADNVVLAAQGQSPRYTYEPEFGDGAIKLTLGLDRSVTNLWDGKSELLFAAREKDVTLMSRRAWSVLGAKPFEDTGLYPG